MLSAVKGLRPETSAKLAASLATCLALVAKYVVDKESYEIKPVGDNCWDWEYTLKRRG